MPTSVVIYNIWPMFQFPMIFEDILFYSSKVVPQYCFNLVCCSFRLKAVVKGTFVEVWPVVALYEVCKDFSIPEKKPPVCNICQEIFWTMHKKIE